MTQGAAGRDRRAFARRMLVASGAAMAMACAGPSQAGGDAAPAAATAVETTAPEAPVPAQPIVVIDHVVPRRDFVGPQPDRFEWTAVSGADAYAIGIWNDSDRLVWRHDSVPQTMVDRPSDLDLTPGTYFWQVTGLQQGRAIARSGQGAFVVE